MRQIFIFIFTFFLSTYVYADFINLVQAEECETIVEIYISHDHIVAKFEIGTQDFSWFSGVIPQKYFEGGYSESDKDVRWHQFMNQQFVIAVAGKPLAGQIMQIDQRGRTRVSGLMETRRDTTRAGEKIIFVEIKYPLPEKYAKISITPPMQQGYEQSMATMGFIVYHTSVPVNDLRFLEQSETLHLNWEDPWYSYFENVNIARHHQSSLMAFLYIEPYEVRHELLTRIKDLEGWIELNYGMNDIIEIHEQDSLKKLIADFLIQRNLVSIDGIQIEPILDRIHFLEVNLAGIQIMEIPKPQPYVSALIGVIFAYPHEGLPQEVTVQWDMFNEKIQRIPATSVGPEGPWPYDLQPSDNVLRWKNFLKHYQLPNVTEQVVEATLLHVPIFAIVFISMLLFLLFRNGWSLHGLSRWRKFMFVLYILLAIISYPIGTTWSVPFLEKRSYTAPEARELISQLLKNTYRAFDFRTEEAIYDKLALCNDKALLQKIYLQTRQSMAIENQGGIEARVNEVFVTKVEEAPASGEMAFKCNWIVRGEVGHWGHLHRRTNQYDAIIRLVPIDGVWKMHDLEIIQEVRL